LPGTRVLTRMTLRILALLAAASALCFGNVTGHWSGTFNVTAPSGETREMPVYLILKEDGGKITGSGGRDISDRHDVLNSKVEGGVIQLEVEAGANPIHLKLTLTGDELNGQVERTMGDGSKFTGKVATKRVKDAK